MQRRHRVMTSVIASGPRLQSAREEIANSISHGVGLLAVLVASPFLIASAAQQGGATGAFGAGVFALTVGLVYLISLLYHLFPPGRTKRVFQVLDHIAIFLLIAGTYTPFTLGVLHGTWGWILLGFIWSLALLGIVFKAMFGIRYPKFSLGLYLAMGWVGVIAIKPLWLLMPGEGLLWLLLGGIAYTTGAAFFAAGHVRYCHFVWHLFVLAGTACHFVAVLRYAG
jgi:hemolysin III